MMDDATKTRLASIHDDVLDAPFESFEQGGCIHHNVGLMQAWVRGYTDPDEHMSTEPPRWTPEFTAWLKAHGGGIDELFVGPPMVTLPDQATADLFRREWHETARTRYPYAQQAEYEHVFAANNLVIDEMRREAGEAE